MRIEPVPSPEEAAAIAAALQALRELRASEPRGRTSLNLSRWRLSGLLGHAVPQSTRLEGSLWSYSSWKG